MIQLTNEAWACSPAAPGWNLSAPATQGTTDGGIAAGFSCATSCDAPTLEIVVENDQGEVVEGTLVESEFGASTGWMLWQPANPLLDGSTYRVKVATAGDIAEASSFSYEVNGHAPSLATAKAPDFEISSAIVLPDGVPCCEQSAGAGSECEAPRCYPDPSDAQAAAWLRASWFDHIALAGYVLVSGEFFTANERVALQPSLDMWVSAKLPIADADDAYCYKVTTRVLLTQEEETFEDCIRAADVPLLDVEAELESLNRSGLRGCDVPSPEYEQDWCAAFAEEVDVNECQPSAEPSACANALEECTPSEPEASASAPPTPSRGDCSVAETSAPVSPWSLSALACALGALGVRRRRHQRG